jgi:hypothetical protein
VSNEGGSNFKSAMGSVAPGMFIEVAQLNYVVQPDEVVHNEKQKL